MNASPFGLAIAIVVLSVTPPPAAAQTALAKNEQALIASLQQDVNRRFWLLSREQKPVVVCPSATDKFDQCKVASRGSFVVESISLQRAYPVGKTTIYASKFYSVRFDDGTTGYIPITQRRYFLTEDPQALAASREAEKKRCEESGDARLNMTKEEVAATCWGNPRQVVQPKGAPSMREYLIYGAGRFLVFENGRLVAIH
jgi:hypothetical protein